MPQVSVGITLSVFVKGFLNTYCGGSNCEGDLALDDIRVSADPCYEPPAPVVTDAPVYPTYASGMFRYTGKLFDENNLIFLNINLICKDRASKEGSVENTLYKPQVSV